MYGALCKLPHQLTLRPFAGNSYMVPVSIVQHWKVTKKILSAISFKALLHLLNRPIDWTLVRLYGGCIVSDVPSEPHAWCDIESKLGLNITTECKVSKELFLKVMLHLPNQSVKLWLTCSSSWLSIGTCTPTRSTINSRSSCSCSIVMG
jgi:hypothetical protein